MSKNNNNLPEKRQQLEAQLDVYSNRLTADIEKAKEQYLEPLQNLLGFMRTITQGNGDVNYLNIVKEIASFAIAFYGPKSRSALQKLVVSLVLSLLVKVFFKRILHYYANRKMLKP